MIELVKVEVLLSGMIDKSLFIAACCKLYYYGFYWEELREFLLEVNIDWAALLAPFSHAEGAL